ncbi:MAG: tyrosine-type recombinase/integrase [Solirubrobacteraceae bacterium]
MRFHDLRHTFGTLAVRRAEVPAVQAWMGHSDIQTTMRYVHHRDRGGVARLLAEAFATEVPVLSRIDVGA